MQGLGSWLLRGIVFRGIAGAKNCDRVLESYKVSGYSEYEHFIEIRFGSVYTPTAVQGSGFRGLRC